MVVDSDFGVLFIDVEIWVRYLGSDWKYGFEVFLSICRCWFRSYYFWEWMGLVRRG